MITVTKTKELDKNRIKLTWHEDEKETKHLYIPLKFYKRNDGLSYYLNQCGFWNIAEAVFEMEFNVAVEVD